MRYHAIALKPITHHPPSLCVTSAIGDRWNCCGCSNCSATATSCMKRGLNSASKHPML